MGCVVRKFFDSIKLWVCSVVFSGVGVVIVGVVEEERVGDYVFILVLFWSVVVVFFFERR